MHTKSLLTTKNAAIFLIILAIFHGFYNTSLQLQTDEAYYWLWSTKLQLSYYDHPPMVAYLIRLFTFFGDGEFFVRLAAVFCMSFTFWYVYLLAKRIFDEEVAWLTLITSAVLPSTSMSYTIITPDAPLFLFWASSLYYSYRAIFEDKWSCYIVSGISIGLLMLSKYMSVLFLGFLFLFLAIKMPKKLLSAKAWAAVLLAFVVFLPVLVWNYQNDWISFRFQYAHGTSDEFSLDLESFFEFIGGLFVVFSPIFFGILIFGVWKFKKWFFNDKHFFIALSFLFPLLFFTYKALFKKMELNWVAISFVGGLILFAYIVREFRLKSWYKAGFMLSVVINLALYFPYLFLPENLNIHNRIFGYKEAVQHMQRFVQKDYAPFSDNYSRAAIFSYYESNHKMSHIPTHSRFSQYSLWDKGIDFSKMKGIYYSLEDELEELQEVFDNVALIEKYIVRKKGYENKTFYIYKCN